MRSFTHILGAIFLLTAQVSFSQSFRHRATIAPVREAAFYKILLPPGITAHLNRDLADLRLYDAQNHEVPYLPQHEEAVQVKKLFKPYQVVSNVRQQNRGTSLVLRNPARNKINNISLLLKNTNVQKMAALSGSNDGQNWYGIEDQYWLHSLYSQSATAEVKMLDFPLSDYEYYKLDINDSASAPLNILSAGYYDTYRENGKYTPVPQLKFTQTDSTDHKTYLKFTASGPVLLDKLDLTITAPGLYRRPATLCERRTYRKRRRQYTRWEPIAQYVLKSDSENSLPVPALRSQEFYLIIENGDNGPLRIETATGYGLNRYLVAALEPGNAYELRFGNEQATAPTYDLAYFKNKIPAGSAVLVPQNITIAAKTAKPNRATWFTNKNIIWAAILGVIALLGYMSYRMLNETAKK
ncbi:MAG: hypothetical protein AVDCRST_MAG95-130 [uncultured Adhaeribacter sp.]|uniref:DUF3999 domain-containing protein n=1 Tax=uncultured Adhaeribacter sp. TaxID=448109 RepID=A0A6J4H0X3_9BACT|nr:MAG: hypothetical protein AVDCRST_MAG95-130 [uncultured Adhaeribacter sp.]